MTVLPPVVVKSEIAPGSRSYKAGIKFHTEFASCRQADAFSEILYEKAEKRLRSSARVRFPPAERARMLCMLDRELLAGSELFVGADCSTRFSMILHFFRNYVIRAPQRVACNPALAPYIRVRGEELLIPPRSREKDCIEWAKSDPAPFLMSLDISDYYHKCLSFNSSCLLSVELDIVKPPFRRIALLESRYSARADLPFSGSSLAFYADFLDAFHKTSSSTADDRADAFHILEKSLSAYDFPEAHRAIGIVKLQSLSASFRSILVLMMQYVQLIRFDDYPVIDRFADTVQNLEKVDVKISSENADSFPQYKALAACLIALELVGEITGILKYSICNSGSTVKVTLEDPQNLASHWFLQSLNADRDFVRGFVPSDILHEFNSRQKVASNTHRI